MVARSLGSRPSSNAVICDRIPRHRSAFELSPPMEATLMLSFFEIERPNVTQHKHSTIEEKSDQLTKMRINNTQCLLPLPLAKYLICQELLQSLPKFSILKSRNILNSRRSRCKSMQGFQFQAIKKLSRYQSCCIHE